MPNIEIIKGNDYIDFIKEIKPNRKTPIYEIINKKYNYKLGSIKWYSSWRKYCFFPNGETIFNNGCIETILLFLNEINKRSD